MLGGETVRDGYVSIITVSNNKIRSILMDFPILKAKMSNRSLNICVMNRIIVLDRYREVYGEACEYLIFPRL